MKWFPWVVVIWLATLPAMATELPLTLDWNKVSLDHPFPVTGGIPLARGALQDPAKVALRIGGKLVPLQARKLAAWPDGSVKWLLLDFQARTSDQTASVIYGPDTPPSPAHEKPIRVLTSDEGVTVDTGVVRFAVRKDGTGFIDELTFQGKSVFAHDPQRRLNVMDALHTKSPDDYSPTNRYLRDAAPDPSQVVINSISIENPGPLHAVVLIEGVYRYKLMGQTITDTDVKGDCPFRIRIHAYAGQSLLRVEHFFYYEGDGDHDFVQTISLRTPVSSSADTVRFLGGETPITVSDPLAGLYQQNSEHFQVWSSKGSSMSMGQTGRRFEGVLDVKAPDVSIAVGVKDFWQNAAKSLHADLKQKQVRVNLWAPESPPLDFRRHARQWSVGEAGTPNDPRGLNPAPFSPEHQPNYRLASKGVGKTHYTMVYPHSPDISDRELMATYQLFNHRPLLWAPPAHYADSLALGKYREYVPGKYVELEKAIDAPAEVWRFSQDYFHWYGFWLYGNVLQSFNRFELTGRWSRDFGRWGWANGDSVGRLGYALMLQAVRKCQRQDLEFAEAYLYTVHDVCSTHTTSYPKHFGKDYHYLKGAAHRHGAWPWADTYVGARGAHPMGAIIYYYLTGEGHVRDILTELTDLTLKNPSGGEGDGPLGGNALMFIFQWETTGDQQWLARVKNEIDSSELLHKAEGGWLIMMSSAFGIHNAMEAYGELTGDDSYAKLAADFADRASPTQMKNHWTWGGYYRVYAHALNVTGDKKYSDAIDEMLPLYLSKMKSSWAGMYPPDQWPPLPGGPDCLIDANIIRDVPFTIYSTENYKNARK